MDGDGSLMFQIKKRKDTKLGYRFMFTICFYQDSRYSESLKWIREVLDIGYVSHRNDGMSELRVNGYARAHEIISDLMPYIRFKKPQAFAIYEASSLLKDKGMRGLSEEDLRRLVDLMLIVQANNYVTKRKKTRKELLSILGLTP